MKALERLKVLFREEPYIVGFLTYTSSPVDRDEMRALLNLADAVGRWQQARDYGDSDKAAAEVAASYARLEALP